MQLKKMTASDWPAVAAIYQSGMDTNLATFEICCPSWETWDASHSEQGRLVALEKETILGWAALTPVSNCCVYHGVAELSIYVDPVYAGKGVATALLSGLVTCSENLGFWTLQSNIMEENKASIKVHEKCGFRIVGLRERIGKDRHGVWRNTILMERRSLSVGL